MLKQSYTIDVIAHAKTPYNQKFGIARQPGIVTASYTHIILEKAFSLDSVRGLEEFGYIWAQFVFHDAIEDGWSALVRPPRLGGKIKKGVFATRSPHRPNHLGLSLLQLIDIQYVNKQVVLICAGSDLLNGTPIVDIKPYIPFVEAHPEAASGFVDGPPKMLNIVWTESANLQSLQFGLTEDKKMLINQSIAQDPRPAYQNIADRVYVMMVENMQIKFNIQEDTAYVLEIMG